MSHGPKAETRSFAAQYALPTSLERCIVLFPLIVFGLFGAAMWLESTQDYAFALVEDNGPVDWLTFVPAFAGGILGLNLSMRARRVGRGRLVWLFYLTFAIGLLFIGGEETSWGQNLFHYQTPELFDRWNEQGEVTVHNLDGLNDRNHFLRLAFGVGGLIGLVAWKSARFADLAPPRALRTWFWLIALKSVLDVFVVRSAAVSMKAYIMAEMSEVVEMLIAMAGLLYVWLNSRRLARSSI